MEHLRSFNEQYNMNTVHFFAWPDEDTDMNTIAFGTEDEIVNDRLCSENLDWDDISELKDLFNDDGSLCEDYLISTETPIDVIDKELISRGYTKDARLKNVGWG